MTRAHFVFVLSVAFLASACSHPVTNQAVTPTRRTGLLVVAHGAGPAWNGAVRAAAAQVRWTGPVEAAFLMGPEAETAGWDAALARIESAGITDLVVVPLMVSSSGSHYRQIQHYAGEPVPMPAEVMSHAHQTRQPGVPARVTAALDASPEMVAIVAARWNALAARDRIRPVVLLGHGPNDESDAARWTAQLQRLGAGLSDAGLRAQLRTAMLRDDAPPAVRAASIAAMRDTVAALAARARDSVVVMTVVIAASSAVTDVRIPADLAGLPVRFVTAPMAPAPQLARWIERVASH